MKDCGLPFNLNGWICALLLVLIIFVAGEAGAQEQCRYVPTAPAQTGSHDPLAAGLNLAGWWKGKRANVLKDKDFEAIHRAGFSFVRVPISSRLLTVVDQNEQSEILRQMRCDFIGLLNHGLAVVVDLHSLHDMPPESSTVVDATLGQLAFLWHKLRPVIHGLPSDKVFLNLLNEPSAKIANWWAVQGKLIATLRPVFPDYTFIVSDQKSAYWSLARKEAYSDPHVLYDFHFYAPTFFTHHNADWTGTPPDSKERFDNIHYPSVNQTQVEQDYPQMQQYIASNWGKQKLASLLAPLIKWREEHHVKLICLEFGVYRPYVDPDSRARWIMDVREILEENHIPWALWEYNKGFGITNLDGGLDAAITTALGLEPL